MLTRCQVHTQLGRWWACRIPTAHWRTGLCAWKTPQLKKKKSHQNDILYMILFLPVCSVCVEGWGAEERGETVVQWLLPTVAGEPLGLVDARRQSDEGAHVCVCDLLAHVLLLQIRTLLQIIVINAPWEDRAELMKRKEEEEEEERETDRKYCCVKQLIGQGINYCCCSR